MSSEATNAQRNVVPDINVRNAILSTDVAKIKKDAETAIEKDVENSVKVQYSLQGNSMSADEQRIVNKARVNGTYLKTPNGKASNLNERQWIQFGDNKGRISRKCPFNGKCTDQSKGKGAKFSLQGGRSIP